MGVCDRGGDYGGTRINTQAVLARIQGKRDRKVWKI